MSERAKTTLKFPGFTTALHAIEDTLHAVEVECERLRQEVLAGETVNASRQLEALGLRKRFPSLKHLAGDMGEALLTAEAEVERLRAIVAGGWRFQFKGRREVWSATVTMKGHWHSWKPGSGETDVDHGADQAAAIARAQAGAAGALKEEKNDDREVPSR